MKVATVIPALNEEGSIGPVVRELLDRGVSRVIVADNGSSDATARVATRAGALVVSEPRQGYGRACLAALRALDETEPGTDTVLFVDGDGADELACIPDLLEPIAGGRADLVIGRRESPWHGNGAASSAAGGRASDPANDPASGPTGNARAHARIGSRWVLHAARLLHGLEARDMGPFRAIRRTTLDALAMDDPTWGWTLQMQLRAHHLGARVIEVPVPRRARTSGRSKVSGSLGVSVRAGIRMGYTLVREWGRARDRS